jgi:hypothetical protein
MSVLNQDALVPLFDGNAVYNEMRRRGMPTHAASISDVLDAVVALIRQEEEKLDARASDSAAPVSSER